jgi:hypothetical protein
MTFEHSDSGRWMLLRCDDVTLRRNPEPVILDIDEAVEWIRKHRPIPWLGSIFSVPPESNLPSGISVSQYLFEQLLISSGEDSSDVDNLFWNKFLPLFPLERLFDLCELIQIPAKSTLLDWFNDKSTSAKPNPLHFAIAEYCRSQGIAECVTTNWDSLFESAFESLNVSVKSVGPDEWFTEESATSSGVTVFHPHGSFQNRNVICSFHAESRGVPLHPTEGTRSFMFLGYSGYEPSMYPHLERIGHGNALWCVRKREDLLVPLRKRLLSLAGTVVFVGDVRELLRRLGYLGELVDFTNNSALPMDIHIHDRQRSLANDVIRSFLGTVSLKEAFESVKKASNEIEMFLRANFFSEYVGTLVRQRCSDAMLGQVIASVLATAPDFLHKTHLIDQFWMWDIAFRVRTNQNFTSAHFDNMHRISRRDDLIEIAGSFGGRLKTQSLAYATFLDSANCDKVFSGDQYIMAMAFGDKALQGELCEISAWNAFINGEVERATALLESAATYYYVSAIPQAGDRISAICRSIPGSTKYRRLFT